MAIELSNLTFTNKADIVPDPGTEAEIINTGTANTRGGNDKITGTSTGFFGIRNDGTINTGNGDDSITGTGLTGIDNGGSGAVGSTIKTGDGNDTITATGSGNGGIRNDGIIDTGDGNDKIIGIGTGGSSIGINNFLGTIDTGDGNDSITGVGSGSIGINNFGTINTGNGNDTITGSSGINNFGTINTGDGRDIVDARQGGFSDTGTINLGNGNDIVKGFGSGFFDGGYGYDKLELTPGRYTVGISGTTVSFASNGITMNTSEFEQLIAGSTMYNFTSLTHGQTITIV
jgi:hypothetical protein